MREGGGVNMKGYDNQGRLLNEMNTSVTSDGKVINTNTTYNTVNGQPTFQNISVRDTKTGKVTTTNVINGKILP
jgi:CHASE2 domain-containing sensor protein